MNSSNPLDPQAGQPQNAPSPSSGISAESAAAQAGQGVGGGASGGNASGNALQDGKKIANDALTGLQTLCDNVINEVSGEVPKLTGDALQVANDFITSKLPGPFGQMLQGILAAGEAAAKAQIDARAAAAISIFKTDVDSAIGHLESHVR